MYVFVYGTLMIGRGNHHLLQTATLVGPALTRHRYKMLDVGFPVLLGPDPDGHLVAGELYEVDRPTLAQLDRLESVGRMYTRERHYVEMTESGRVFRVYYYVGVPAFWQSRKHRVVSPSLYGNILIWSSPLAFCSPKV